MVTLVVAVALASGGPAPAGASITERGATLLASPVQLPDPVPLPNPVPADGPSQRSFRAPWSWPLSPQPAVLRHFQPPPERWNAGHRGVDLSAARSSGSGGAAPLLSPTDGFVSFSGMVVDRSVLSIAHGDGLVSSFEPVASILKKGDRVARGDAVGTVGGPPHCPVLCVHWGVRLHGEYVDPLAYVSDRRPSVLLPLRR